MYLCEINRGKLVNIRYFGYRYYTVERNIETFRKYPSYIRMILLINILASIFMQKIMNIFWIYYKF